MKTILLTVVIMTFTTSIFAMDDTQVLKENKRLCSVFENKTKIYEQSMRNDPYAKATLKNYKNKMDRYCSK